MPNLDRFAPPYADNTEACASCQAAGFDIDMLYDERNENYFCDEDCFLEWADANFEEVSRYYYDANIN